MNTLAWISGSLAVLWLAIYAFDTLDSTPIGIAMVGVFFLALVFTIHGAFSDLQGMIGNRDEDE